MNIRADFMMPLVARCLLLARSYLILPSQFHRWCIAVIACIVALLIGCFIAYAFVEKYHIESSVFYGHVRFSFVDHGYPEIFGYILELASCTIFALYAWLCRKKYWYMWAIILLIIFFDDAFKMHESIGHIVSEGLGVSSVTGDILGFASTGLLSVAFWITGVRMISDQNELCAYLVFTVYFSVLIFFGVGVDAMHGLLGESMSQTVFTLVEDGGELFMIAIITLSSLGMLLQQPQPVVVEAMPVDSVFSKT